MCFLASASHEILTVPQVRGEKFDEVKASKHKQKKPNEQNKRAERRMVYEADDLDGVADAGKDRQKKKTQEMGLPLSKRIALQQEKSEHIIQIKGKFGAKEIAYVPKKSRKQTADDSNTNSKQSERAGPRRGIKELRLKRQKF